MDIVGEQTIKVGQKQVPIYVRQGKCYGVPSGKPITCICFKTNETNTPLKKFQLVVDLKHKQVYCPICKGAYDLVAPQQLDELKTAQDDKKKETSA